MSREVYLDHAASAPMFAEAIEVMAEVMAGFHGNPSGSHRSAREAQRVVDESREELASLLGRPPGDLVFTSGGTESDNLAISGPRLADDARLLVSSIEHPAVGVPARRRGAEEIPVTDAGVLDLDAFGDMVGPDVGLVSVMTVNNEVGTVQPVEECARILAAAAPAALLHTDAIQAFRWMDLSPVAGVADMMSISAHKFGGPNGVGILVVPQGLPIEPQMLGGGQERNRRSGTHNVAAIAAMTVAARLTAEHRDDVNQRVAERRDELRSLTVATLEGVHDTSAAAGADVVPSHLHLCVEGVDSESLLFLLDAGGVRVSAASSCASGAQESSHVLTAMGIDGDLAEGSIRMSLGPETSADDVRTAADVFVESVGQLRSFAP